MSLTDFSLAASFYARSWKTARRRFHKGRRRWRLDSLRALRAAGFLFSPLDRAMCQPTHGAQARSCSFSLLCSLQDDGINADEDRGEHGKSNGIDQDHEIRLLVFGDLFASLAFFCKKNPSRRRAEADPAGAQEALSFLSRATSRWIVEDEKGGHWRSAIGKGKAM